ncbi:CsgG/HfaB family protein [Sneathiella aquimaris]|uniref:CsgG/HfaB family protein n=1 Tax=Sneathiella aquimaris TaxID=2599305 RepID=UPI00146A9F49|nr:CsgG/HfaB family protein [Sneathiella aquimaris]
MKKILFSIGTLFLISGCVASANTNIALEDGPPVQSITTPYDDLLSCVAEQKSMQGTWAVGEILDQTGKRSIDTDGNGRFISQGAGDMMQTMLTLAGAEKTVNRRDPRPIIMEVNWGLRKANAFKAMDYYITGSINSLDFLPGAAAELSIAGIGPRYRQHRAVVGLDLHLTDAKTTEVISAVNISKQIFAEQAGFGLGRFFGTTLVDFDLNGGNREPMQLSLRSMLQYGLYKMVSNIQPEIKAACQYTIENVQGVENLKQSKINESFTTENKTSSSEL